MEPSGLEPLTSWVRSMDGLMFAFRHRLQVRAVWVRPWRAFMSSNSALRGGPRVPRPSPPTRRASTAARRRPGAGRRRLPTRGRRRGRGPRGRRPPPSRACRARCQRPPAGAPRPPVSPPSASRRARRPRKASVATGPGPTALTRIPLGPRSSAAVRTSPSTACFEAVYEAWAGAAWAEFIEAVTTIAPPSTRARAPCFRVVGDASHVHRERSVERLEIELGRPAPGRDDAGVGDDDIEAAKPAGRRRHGPFEVVLVGHVGGERDPSLRARALLEIDDRADCARACEGLRDRGAEAADASGDERDTAVEQAGERAAHARGAAAAGSGRPGHSPACACARAMSSPTRRGRSDRRRRDGSRPGCAARCARSRGRCTPPRPRGRATSIHSSMSSFDHISPASGVKG